MYTLITMVKTYQTIVSIAHAYKPGFFAEGREFAHAEFETLEQAEEANVWLCVTIRECAKRYNKAQCDVSKAQCELERRGEAHTRAVMKNPNIRIASAERQKAFRLWDTQRIKVEALMEQETMLSEEYVNAVRGIKYPDLPPFTPKQETARAN